MSDANEGCAETGALLTLLKAQEEKLLAADLRASPEKVAELLADDFVEFARSGRIYDRDQSIAALAAERGATLRKARDFRVSLLGEGIALLTYRSTRQSGSDLDEQHSLRSSVWVRVQGRWRMRFHQGTPIR
ncbi:DUF4440 domain-containing protein [Bosea psychrotolerans]|uniref:DUF4440 domain-containing protein n=1 Tax=Bosea psychrotolerans TaxID=1871628 RepID=A0A2S4M2H5_9HYPH|nr:nuclear transport factor 2 family protein [Bosea psychrotolerans]POR48924.1 hypothetical protein CYD53_11355 [Bosea psychrotolerans]